MYTVKSVKKFHSEHTNIIRIMRIYTKLWLDLGHV